MKISREHNFYLISSAVLAVSLYFFLESNKAEWSELSVLAFGFLAILPAISSLVFGFKRRSRAENLSAGIFTLLLFGFTNLFLTLTSGSDTCHSKLGEDHIRKAPVVIYACESTLHESEHWIHVYPSTWEGRFKVGWAGDRSAIPYLYSVGAEIYRSSEDVQTFISPPETASISEDGTLKLKITFLDGTSKEVELKN